MLKIVIIGMGHWGPNYVRNFGHFLNEAKVTAVSDLRKTSSERIISKGIKFYSDWKKMLKEERPDAVVIATPAATHYAIAKKCLLLGKHVLVEKPLALNVKEGKELLELARKVKKILLVGHTFLYNSAVRKIKEYINHGRLGKIYYLQATRTHLGLVRDDVNVIWDLAVHDVSVFNYLLDSVPEYASACAGEYLQQGKADVAFITLAYPGKILAHIQVSWIDSNKVRQITIVGSKCRVIFDDLDNLEPIRIFEKGISVEAPVKDFGEFKMLLRDGDILSPKIRSKEPLHAQCRHFLDCIISHNRPLTDAKNGLEVVRVMSAIAKSLRRRGKMVKV